MADFIIHFLISNILISGIIGFLIIMKKLLKNYLTNRIQYHLWFFILGLLLIPFVPLNLVNYPKNILLFFKQLIVLSFEKDNTKTGIQPDYKAKSSGVINDLALSVSDHASSNTANILFAIWFIGVIVMLILACKSIYNLRKIKQSALPLQNMAVKEIYNNCLSQTGIQTSLPVYSTAFLKCPIMVGFFRPAIYLPIQLISDYNEIEVKHMILHELNHYLHKDTIINHFTNIFGILYWFNPIIWTSIREMRIDREIACDTSVLNLLDADSYSAYGNTLINFAEKISLTPFPFASGISGSMRQMKHRILNITNYQAPTTKKKIASNIVFILIGIITFCISPALSIYASDTNTYKWNVADKNITYVDLSPYYEKYDGSFVLYELTTDRWIIYNSDKATTRVAPDSTYKIYSALFGLNEQIISPNNTYMKWDYTDYPFDEWESDQTLDSAMASSVNWYFQTIDSGIGANSLSAYLSELNYGNMLVQQNTDTFWMESSLKISPVEQVELLVKLNNNNLPFKDEDMNLVKDSIHIASSDIGDLYGKTGTGRVNKSDVNGWFIGYVTSQDHTYFFATNIQSDCNATGLIASDITLSLLSELDIWN